MKRCLTALLVAAVLATAAIAQVAPPNSSVHGKTLQQWLTAYWGWYYATGGTEVFQPSLQPVVFLPIPVGDLITTEAPWTFQGAVEITLKPGTSFVLPSFAWVTERYDPTLNIPDDSFFSDETVRNSVFRPGSPTNVPEILLDGKPVTVNYWDYYVGPSYFDEPVIYAEPTGYGSVAALGFQGVGFVYRPLPPGTHVLKIYEELKFDELGIDVIYDNTWIIKVLP